MYPRYATNTGRWQARQRPAPRPSVPPAAGRELSVDRTLLATVIGLALFGVVMVYSASAFLAEKNFDNQFHFLIRQGAWAAIGFIGMAVAMRIDYRMYKRPAFVFGLLAVTFALLVAVFFFPERNSTHRWITYGRMFSLQPSEVAKLSLTAFLGYFLERRINELESYWLAFAPAAFIAGLMIVLIGLQPDLGTAMSIAVIFGVMMFHAGSKVRHLATLLIPAVPALIYMLMVPWRFQRLIDFLNPWENQTTSGFQVVQSMIAIGSGGVSGVGFAQGKQKLFYLPAPHTDFIFAVIGEELGLIGAMTLVLVFGLFAWRGFRAARHAPDVFGQLVAVGLTTMITVQALFNISVAIALVPTKGIPLPFISSGGTSLAISLFAAGVLLNVTKHGVKE